MKKSLLVLTGILGLTGALALSSCGNVNNKTKEIVSFNEMYSTSAITGISVLSNNTQVRKMSKHDLTDLEKEKVIENYKIVEGLISDDVIKTKNVKSDKEGYETMYSITITNLDGSKENYSFYFNELTEAEYNEKEALKKKEALASDDDEEEEKESEETEESEEESEIETESHLKGIVILNDKEYEMKGAKEVEKEADELEIEMSFEITDPETNERVVIKQETETEEEDGITENEEEFKISKYDANDTLIYSKEIEIEREGEEVEYKLVEKTNTSKKSFGYEILTDKDGNKYVEAEIVLDKEIIRAEFKAVKDSEGNISYEFISENE